MRVLVIEDDTRLAGILERALVDEGYKVDVMYDGVAGDQRLQAGGVDLAILDLGLPGRDGLELLRSLRATGSTLPVLVLTGRDAVEQRVQGLDAGADDYLVKPFALDELLARVRSLMRRGQGKEPVLRYADVEVDPSRGTAMRAGERLDLRPREYDLLLYMMRNPDQVLTRDQLHEAVWHAPYDSMSNVLEVYVGYLRGHLEAHGPRLVHTVRGKGYVLKRSASP